LVLPTKYKNKRLQFRLATNLYTGNTVPEYEEVVDLAQLWTGIENRPGSLARKEEIYRRDGGKCGICGEAVDWEGGELDHSTSRYTFRDKKEADRKKNLWIVQQFPKTRKSKHSSGIPTCLFVNHHAKMWLSGHE